MELVDTHCHLQFDQLSDTAAVLEEAEAAGVKRVVCPGTTLEDSQRAIAIAAKYPNVWAAVGIHPHDADKARRNIAKSIDQFEKLLKQPKVVAIGEIGLDYYKNYSPTDTQKELFARLMRSGAETGKPFIFHVRDAWDDFWEVVDRYPGIKGVVHSFSAYAPQLEAALERGFYIGLNGIMTFTKDQQQLAAAKTVPLDRLLLETDAPFLTPTPFRGTVCTAKHVRVTAEFLGKLRGESLETLATATTANAVALLSLSN